MTNNNKKKTCSICFLAYQGHGHNAAPISDGLCCDECNGAVLISSANAMVLPQPR